MSDIRSRAATAGAGLREWLPVGLRSVVALVVAPAGALKYLDYGSEVAAFASYGVPATELVVPAVAVVELVAAIAIALGIAPRIAALALIPVMVAAMVLYAVVPSNSVVLLGCVGILALGPGKFAVWDPESEGTNGLERLGLSSTE